MNASHMVFIITLLFIIMAIITEVYSKGYL